MIIWKLEGTLESAPLTHTMTNQDDTPLDSSIFTYDANASTLSVMTQDLSDVKAYDLLFRAQNGAYDNAVELGITVTIQYPPCELDTEEFAYKVGSSPGIKAAFHAVDCTDNRLITGV